MTADHEPDISSHQTSGHAPIPEYPTPLGERYLLIRDWLRVVFLGMAAMYGAYFCGEWGIAHIGPFASEKRRVFIHAQALCMMPGVDLLSPWLSPDGIIVRISSPFSSLSGLIVATMVLAEFNWTRRLAAEMRMVPNEGGDWPMVPGRPDWIQLSGINMAATFCVMFTLGSIGTGAVHRGGHHLFPALLYWGLIVAIVAYALIQCIVELRHAWFGRDVTYPVHVATAFARCLTMAALFTALPPNDRTVWWAGTAALLVMLFVSMASVAIDSRMRYCPSNVAHVLAWLGFDRHGRRYVD